MLDRLWSIFTQDIAIDLGTATTLVTVRGEGIVIDEPSVVAVNNRTNQILSVGAEAKQMIGRTPANIVAIRPLRDGVVSDFDATEAMIRYFIQKVFRDYGKLTQINRPRVVVGVPSLITEVEARAVVDAAKSAGARKVFIIEEPVAAAVGSDLPIEDAMGSMIIDIGGGTTDIAIISMGGMVADSTIKIAGDELDEAIINYIRSKYNLMIGYKLAEEVKINLGSVAPLKKETDMSVSGRDLISGLPKNISISSIEVREALIPVVEQIADAAIEGLEKAPPEIIADLSSRGVKVVGGGALIRNIDKFLSSRLRLPVQIGDRPKEAVVMGTMKLLDNIELLEKLQVSDYVFE